MSGTVVSKNLYELLGNTHDEDSDKEPEVPTKTVEKPLARTTKRNATGEAPATKAPATSEARGGRRGGYGGNDGAFRDRNAGRATNQGKSTGDENARPDRAPRAAGTYEGRGRGGRGRGGANNYDRHSRGVGGESEKQAAHGWGAVEGGAELADEQAGEAIAKAEEKEALTGDGDAVEPAAEAEPEDNSISYADYLAQQAEKKLSLGNLEVRKVTDSKVDKKWANAKAITKEEEEDFVAASAGKAKRERERAAKNVKLEIDQRYVEPTERGGRDGFRGGRGRGDGQRGGRGGRGEFRGRGEGRGEGRGGRGRGDRAGGPPRNNAGPRNNASAPINTADSTAFPSLGA